MAYYTHTKDPIGVFVEKDVGNFFEYSHNDDPVSVCEDFPHKVWVGGIVNDQGWRYANVKKTVAYIVTDEDEFGLPVIEKWDIKKHREYS
tara:strand:- start:1068 stop:1337 length:270 start_codon:yes stop_codon:yes gene_type:complete